MVSFIFSSIPRIVIHEILFVFVFIFLNFGNNNSYCTGRTDGERERETKSDPSTFTYGVVIWAVSGLRNPAMKGVFSAPGDYIYFKSQVPLHKIPVCFSIFAFFFSNSLFLILSLSLLCFKIMGFSHLLHFVIGFGFVLDALPPICAVDCLVVHELRIVIPWSF